MPVHTRRLTDSEAQRVAAPSTGYALYWCPRTPGFAVRVTAKGARSWVLERVVDGKNIRRTLGRANGRGAISAEAARAAMLTFSSELQLGRDPLAVKREERNARKIAIESDALTLEKALKDYVKGKRRGKDGLALKERTKADYLAMLASGRTSKNGRPLADGELAALAGKPIAKITADDVRKVHADAAARGARRATYAMQVLRAVLNWHGIKVPGNPLSRDTAGRERIVLKPTLGKPNPIPPERLAAWWAAATKIAELDGGVTRRRVAADLYRFMLLTGARGGEVKSLTVADLDLMGARVTLRDTKNRTDHVIVLSRQALAIATRHAEGKKARDALFSVDDARKTLRAINASAGVTVSGHDLRATFASVAEELVSSYALKRMLNHADAGDVTGGHYIGKSEAQLRAGWQAVADFIAGPAPAPHADAAPAQR